MRTFSERLSHALAESGLTKAQFAESMNLSYQAISQALLGATKAFTAKNNQKAAVLLDVSASWLASGDGPRRDPGAHLGALSKDEASLIELLRSLPEDVRAEACQATQQIANEYAKRVSALLARSGA
jgi:transcriptional regulator with XRE-family HTH domain